MCFNGIHSTETHGNECRLGSCLSALQVTIPANLLMRLIFVLMMEAVRTTEMSVYSDETARRYIPEGSNLHTRRHENLKSHIVVSSLKQLDCYFSSIAVHLRSHHLTFLFRLFISLPIYEQSHLCVHRFRFRSSFCYLASESLHSFTLQRVHSSEM
jgi:hypothetical protein